MVTIKYADTLISKNKLKKLILLKFFFNKNNINVYVNLKGIKHKNVLLSSPFHFKTVKSHLYIPTLNFYVCFGKKLSNININKFKLIGNIVFMYKERQLNLNI